MKIESIKTINYNTKLHNITHKSEIRQFQSSDSVHPIFFNDHNCIINFKGGRKPEDFYEFNKDKMPATMNKYLQENYSERSKLAPIQVLSEAYDNLNIATSVDDIKELFPEEEKFALLKPANYNTAKNGILRKIKEIKDLSENPEPLFKDGTDDLTTYIVKKIYLEGKTTKEIDKDFAIDINPIYELAAKSLKDEIKRTPNESIYFSNSTTYNLGIRFPQVEFWNSFISTRDDYAQTKRIKTSDGKFVNQDSKEGRTEIARKNGALKPIQKKRKFNFNPHKLKNISTAIANAKGDNKKAWQEVKHKTGNSEELTFLQKYWSQIMSVATEKIHLSEELIDFNMARTPNHKVSQETLDKFISNSELSKQELTPLQIFWNERSDLKEYFSNAINDTITLFSEVYGIDGNNEEFRNLIEYSENIKPLRERKKAEHNKLQAEYDEMAKELMQETKDSADTTNAEIMKALKNNPSNAHNYIINGEEIVLDYDLEKQAKELFAQEFKIMPSKLYSVYLQLLDKQDIDKNRFWISCCYGNNSDNPQLKRITLSDDEIANILHNQQELLEEYHNSLLESCRYALFQFGLKHNLLTNNDIRNLTTTDVVMVRDAIESKLKVDSKVAQKEIQANFTKIYQPLTSKERNSIRINLLHNLKKQEYQFEKDCNLKLIIDLISRAINEHKTYFNLINCLLGTETLLETVGGPLRLLLDDDTPPEVANGLRVHTYMQVLKLFPREVFALYKLYPKEYLSIANSVTDKVGFKQMVDFARKMI